MSAIIAFGRATAAIASLFVTMNGQRITFPPAGMPSLPCCRRAGSRMSCALAVGLISASVAFINCGKRGQPAEVPPPATPPLPPARLIQGQRTCMGTLCEIKVFFHDEAQAQAAIGKALDELARLEALMTTWRTDSDISRINAAAGQTAVVVAPETFEVIKQSQWVAELTGGAFDITIGAFHGLWKFDEDNDGSLPRPLDVKRRLELVNYKDVLLDESDRSVMLKRAGQRITLGGVAKGFAVDGAVSVLRRQGIHNFIVQAGGDLFAAGMRGDRPWRVGIQDPRGPRGQIVYRVELSDQAFNTSGDYERYIIKDGKRYHHILDARTGFPAQGVRAVTLLAKTAFMADLFDTALLIVGVDKAHQILKQLPDIHGVIIDEHNHVHISSGLANKLVKVREPTDAL